MATQRKSEFAKARGDARRGITRLVGSLPGMARLNWRTVIMPWRLIPMPIGMALIALVALAMVLDTGGDAVADAPPLDGQGVVIGADTVPEGTRCQEDEVITYRALLGYDGVGCVHYEYVVMDFIAECLVGNSEHGSNNASYHVRDDSFRSWCSAVIDDGSDGMLSLADMVIDTAPTATPTLSPMATATPSGTTSTDAPVMPSTLPSSGTGGK